MINQQMMRRLDAILEEAPAHNGSAYQAALAVMNALEDGQKAQVELQRDLKRSIDHLCSSLALSVRQNQPSLNVQIGDNCCKIGYMTKSLIFTPDLKNRQWVVDSPNNRFLSRFKRSCPVPLTITDDLATLASAVAMFFAAHFRSIGEDLVCLGIIIMDERPAHLGQLMDRVTQLTNEQFNWGSKRHSYTRSTWPSFLPTRKYRSNSKIAEDMSGMAAQYQPQQVKQRFVSAIKAVGLDRKLHAAGIVYKESKDGQRAIFCVNLSDGSLRPIATYEYTQLGEASNMEKALDQLHDLSLKQAPGTSEQIRKRFQDREKSIRDVAKQYAMPKEQPQQPQPMPL